MQKELFLCSSSLYLRTAGDDRSNLAFILHMILASGSANILYIPPPHTINRTKTRFFLNISSSSQVIHSFFQKYSNALAMLQASSCSLSFVSFYCATTQFWFCFTEEKKLISSIAVSYIVSVSSEKKN